MNCEYESIIDFEVVYYLIMKMYCKLSFILTMFIIMFAKKTMTYDGIQILGYWCKHNYINCKQTMKLLTHTYMTYPTCIIYCKYIYVV